MLQAALHATLLCWTPNTAVAPGSSAGCARCCQPFAQLELPPDFDIEELPDLPKWALRKKPKGARAKRNEVSDYAKTLGAEKGYASVDDFVQEHVPASGQPGQRRRKKEWDPSKRKPHKREQRRTTQRRAAKEASADEPPLSHASLLRVARPALAAAASAAGVELVGVVVMRPPAGTTPSAFRCWIAPVMIGGYGDDDNAHAIITAEDLALASSALRDALWAMVAGKPAISVIAVGNGASSQRPLFDAADFERFAGRRVQLTFRDAHDGRRRLVGELLGLREPTEALDGEQCAVVMDESAGAPVLAPLSKLLYSDKTALLPKVASKVAPVATSSERDARKAKEAADAALEAKLAEMIAADQDESSSWQ